ncbi:MAG TPA: pyridoxamine 5'-phosphate oxidase family protein [Planctomycetota bacterium]|nr:pyridoxamine 5'-phosphate oxidase family protein [Planctomycetota bacterium]
MNVEGDAMREETHEFIESREEMEKVLAGSELGFLGLVDGDGCYVVPMNYSYHGDGRILFHCALEGKKLDCIRAHPNVSFTVARQAESVRPHAQDDTCHIDSDSVICTGVARIIEDLDERAEALNRFNRAYRPKADDVPADQVKNCGVVEITLTEMTGRRERERKRTLWRWRF